jgi:plastocyanin
MKTVTALAVVVLAVAGCGSSSNSSDTSSSPSASTSSSTGSAGGGGYGSASSSSTTAAASTSDDSGKTEVEMYDDYFKPKTISGKPGSTITVQLKNEGTKEHNFKIDGQPKADADVEPGKDGKATVKIPASGSVQFYCEYHKGLGMVGTVTATQT